MARSISSKKRVRQNASRRAVNRWRTDRVKQAVRGFEEALQAGDKTKAAGSYGRAINLRPKDEAARSGFARVGGKPGQSYDTF